MSRRIEHLHQAKSLTYNESEAICKDPEPPPPQVNLLPHTLAQEVEKDIIEEGTKTHPLKIWGMML